ncbi:polyprenol phosphomannose-dependent alpha 1,6 mannosyltransferase MptB [Glutamicibacter sp. JC586]|uniref:polyprenol phosphomannose-dependent alpha 1,6 mannosyltransferase MptB n=1 Tax=Glutamicibacter sp. JC586 TaxID=2590552 RepID=UPI001359E62F|nr:polyprenol phosphomannose-dependent alpha 1,6 mannosyltransferase MptB [Glutamicibacter sp. JC586]
MAVLEIRRKLHGESLRSLGWQGFAASVMITVASWGVGWFPRNQLSPIARSGFFIEFRTEAGGVITCIVLMAVGMVWLTRTWILTRPKVQKATEITSGQLGKLITLWSAPLIFSFPILSRDVYSYLAQGRMLHADKSPYLEGVSALPGWFDGGSDGLWAQSPSPYGPFFLVLSRIIFFVSNGIPEIGVGLLRIVAALGVLGCYHFTTKLAKKMGQNPNWANWAIVGNPLFLLTTIGGVHNDALMIAGVFSALAYAYDRRAVASTMALAIAVSVKPIVLLALPFIGLILLNKNPSKRARWIVWLKVSLLSLIWLTIIGAVTNLWFGWVPAMFSAGDAAFPYAPVGLIGWSMSQLVGMLGGNGALVNSIIVQLFQLFALAIVARLALVKNISNPVRLTAWSLSAVVLLAPIIQPWYVLWLMAFFAISHRVSWSSEKLMIYVSTLILIAVFVDQLSIEQWHTAWLMKTFAGVLAVLLFAGLFSCDSITRRILDGPSGPLDSAERRGKKG